MSERTLFYGLPLACDGSAEVESLRSYVERLSYAHNLRPRRLVEVLLERYPVHGIGFDYATLLRHWDVHGSGKSGTQLTERLEKATLTPLGHSTLHRFAGLFPAAHFARYRDTAYCPECVAETEDPTHGRLLWEVQCVTACPKHRVLLRAAAECGAPKEERLPVNRRPAFRSVCSACGSIGFRCLTDAAIPAPIEAVRVAEHVGKMLALSDAQCAGINLASLQAGIGELVREVYGSRVANAAVDAGLSRGSVSTWVRGVNRPSLSQLVQLCLRANAELVALLAGRYERVGDNEDEFGVQAKLTDRSYVRVVMSDHDILATLDEAAKETDAPTVQTVCARIGLNPRVARAKFPVAVGRLVARCTERRVAEWNQRHEDAVVAYTKAAAALQERGATVGAKALQREARLVAFSQNPARVRALDSVLKKVAEGAERVQGDTYG